MKNKILYAGFILFLVASGCASTEKLYPAAPSLLPSTQREMKTAGFWISRHPFPDKAIMTPAQIEKFNQSIREDLKLTKDITLIPETVEGESLREDLEKTLKDFTAAGYYLPPGGKADGKFFQAIEKNMALERISGPIAVQFGLVVHYADQRLLPTQEPLYQIRGDVDFDELQNSALDVGTPVAVLQTSANGKWVYVESPLTPGWVEAQKVAVCSAAELKDFLSRKDFMVVISPKADIFLDEGQTQFYDYARMGVKLPMDKIVGAIHELPLRAEIVVPTRDVNGMLILKNGYMNADEVHEGYLPYTPRNVIRQAFKMLNALYGWGGMYGEQDCSRFLQEVFATTGISLPRNSSDQAKVGKQLAGFTGSSTVQQKLSALKTIVGGTSILPMKGHIMLYLGMVNEKPYAVHAVWAYREKGSAADVVRVINRVAVTDLFLGEGSKKGSLLKRLKAIRSIEGQH